MTDTHQIPGAAEASAAEQINAAITGSSMPIIEPPAAGEVTLLRGLVGPDGRRHLTARVREMTGADEEAIARFNVDKGSQAEFISLLLSRAVVAIGDMPMDVTTVNQLMAGDRDLLFLGIVRATYGRWKEFDLKCPECKGDSTVKVDLEEEFPLRHTEIDPLQSTYVQTLRDGTKVELRLPTGNDQLKMATKKHATMPEYNTGMIALCTVSVNGEPLKDKETWARSLGMLDRRDLAVFLGNAPGPTTAEVTVPCATCAFEMNVPMDWASLLWP